MVEQSSIGGILADAISCKMTDIFLMASSSNLNEKQLDTKYWETLGAESTTHSLDGLFGLTRMIPDGIVTLHGWSFLSEFKKVAEQKECGFWHTLIQAQLYRVRDSEIPIVCTVLDWGRLAGTRLHSEGEERPELALIDRMCDANMHFVRVSLNESPFIEHNLNGQWKMLR